MTADALKSTSITNLDASPYVPNTTGEGAPGYLRNNSDYVTPTALGLADTTSTYKVIRVPTNIKLKNLKLVIDTALDSGSPALAWDVGAYYSDSTIDGTPVANQGALISANCFAAAVVIYAAGEADILTAYSVSKRNQPLWTALAIGINGNDPGGFIDVVLAVHTAANTAASHKVGVNASYVD